MSCKYCYHCSVKKGRVTGIKIPRADGTKYSPKAKKLAKGLQAQVESCSHSYLLQNRRCPKCGWVVPNITTKRKGL